MSLSSIRSFNQEKEEQRLILELLNDQRILQKINIPNFISDILDLKKYSFYRGGHFIDRPHYQKTE